MNFPLFSSHLDLAHRYWKALLRQGDWVIDATCGNGHDTLALAKCVLGKTEGGVLALDVQQRALDQTRARLAHDLHPEQADRVHLYLQSHEKFPPLAAETPIRLIVYNLGYLPGSDKKIKTTTSSTLASLKQGLKLVAPGGAISIMCYPGHPEGFEEQQILLEFCNSLNCKDLQICHHQWLSTPRSPSLLFIQKII